jgi:hypothetical protein
MENTKRFIFFLILLFALGSFRLSAQNYNYWSMGSNTPSSLLAGAVVGGGAGITSIFYNPAGIGDIEQSKIAFNASLFSFNWHLYDNALGHKSELDYLEWQVRPRFLSYQFRGKKNQKFSYQFTVFNRNQQLLELFDQRSFPVKSVVGQKDLVYTASYDLEKNFSDYWLGVGFSYDVNSRLSLGMSLFGSGKTFRYYQYRRVFINGANDSLNKSSNWESMERQYFYVISLITKIGVRYRFDRLSLGLNVSLPSLRLWGDGYSKRNLQYSNVFYEGHRVPDYLHNGYNNHIVANLKEPFSVSAGLMYTSPNKKSLYFFSMEYFAKIDTYKAIDNTKVSSFYEDESQPGDDFLSYKFGARDLLNVGFGYRNYVNESLSYLLGFRTDFAAYEVSNEGQWNGMSEYVNIGNPLYHLSGGIEFKFKANTVLFGTEYVLGINKNALQFANFDFPGVYDPDQHLALQDYPGYDMKYQFHGLGLYIGYSFDF